MSLFNLSEFLTSGLLNKSKNPVFRIQSITTGQEYILKKLQRHDFEAHLSDFAELTYILRCCHHPNIIKILGFSMKYSNHEYILCLLMDLYKTDLQRVIDSNRKNKEQIPKKQLILITKQLIDALYFMQTQAKIAHRDLKPANILLDSNGNALITDFSEAYFSDGIKHNEYREDGIKGTPEYMSPELKKLFMGFDIDTIKYDPYVSDVYSLGVLLINLACSFEPEPRNSIKEKLEIIESVYGRDLKDLYEILVQENQDLRGDFKILIKRKEFLALGEGIKANESFVINKNDGDNADRISIIVEDENINEDEEIENECFGRKAELKRIKTFDKIEKIEENEIEERSVNLQFSSPNRKQKSGIAKEMRFLKEELKNKGLNEDFKKKFRKIVMGIKELELENRVIKREMKDFMFRKSKSFSFNFNRGNVLGGNVKSEKNSFLGLSEYKAIRKSMNIVYNMEQNNSYFEKNV